MNNQPTNYDQLKNSQNGRVCPLELRKRKNGGKQGKREEKNVFEDMCLNVVKPHLIAIGLGSASIH